MSGISIVYIVAALCSLLMLVAYCVFIKKKFTWFWVLFSSICVVNVGYFVLSISKTLDEALLANRIAYLGSVFLPVAMLLIILNATGLKHPKWLWIPLVCLGVAVFAVAASPGYCEIYYKDTTTLITINGVSVLDKDYGPLHVIYLFYLLGYFVAMITLAIRATTQKKTTSAAQTVMLLGAVFVNICVWAIEQFVKIELEFLAFSYVISELFLIGLYVMIQENERCIEQARQEALLKSGNEAETLTQSEISQEVVKAFNQGISELTYTERLIYDLYISGKTTKEVLEEMNIKENTLKYHNKNIYGKLGVSSRKELKAIAKCICD